MAPEKKNAATEKKPTAYYWKGDLGWYLFKFPYSEEVTADMKIQLPERSSFWHPEYKFRGVKSQYLSKMLFILEKHFIVQEIKYEYR